MPNVLRDYFQAHRTGRGIWKWDHYFEIYERHFAKFVGRRPHVVEIGVYSGGSLGMWHHYFGPGCHVTGIDIEVACLEYADVDTTIRIGDQADREFWQRFRSTSKPFDVVIDDGGHTFEQQRVTLEETLGYLNPGGVYLCEDAHGIENQFAKYVHELAVQLNADDKVQFSETARELTVQPTPFQQAHHSVHLYPFVVVIERHESKPTQFRAPQHGTEWQPFSLNQEK